MKFTLCAALIENEVGMDVVLIAGFEGENNSSKYLLDNMPANSNIDKLYLVNDLRNAPAR